MSNLDLQKKLIEWGLLDPPADNMFGTQSEAALNYASKLCGLHRDNAAQILKRPPPIVPKLDNSYASRVIRYMQLQGYFVAVGERMYNVVYIEGINDDSTLNSDAPNQWNDLRTVIEIPETGVPRFMGMWNATTEPGNWYTLHPMNPGGAFRIKFDQYKAWVVGTHGNSNPHEALVQCGEIEGYRDANEDYVRTGDKLVKGLFNVNQHWGYNLEEVGKASAGCLVGRTRTGHREFMALIKRDRRYQVNQNYTFWTTIVAGDDLVKKCPI